MAYLDTLTWEGAQRIGALIRTYWRRRGYHGIEISYPSFASFNGVRVYGVRSNVSERGYPPREKQNNVAAVQPVESSNVGAEAQPA